MIALLLKRVAQQSKLKTAEARTGLEKSHPLIRFFRKNGDTVKNFLALDDMLLMSSFERMTKASDKEIKDIAQRLRDSRLFKALDLRTFGPDLGAQRMHARMIDTAFKDALGKTVLKDESAALSIYSQVGGDDEKAHKKIQILDGDQKVREISSLSKIIDELSSKRTLVRYYFANEADRETAHHKN